MPTICGEKVDVQVEDLGYKLRLRIGTRRHWGMYVGIAIMLAVMLPGTWFAASLLTGTSPVEALPVSGERLRRSHSPDRQDHVRACWRWSRSGWVA